VSVIWRKPVLTYAVSVVSLTASVNSVNGVEAERGRQCHQSVAVKAKSVRSQHFEQLLHWNVAYSNLPTDLFYWCL